MKNKSFTLIELLVVIAIIGLLASVILVNTGGIRSKAKIAKALEFSQSVQNALGSEAVGIWSFDEGTEGAPLVSAKDASGYNNNGTCSGASCPTYTSDTPQKVVGSSSGKYALSFNGSTNYVQSANNVGISGSSPRTLEFWAKVNAVASDQSILGWGAALQYKSFVPSIYVGHWFFWGQAYDWDTGITPQTGIWQHHAVTFDGTRVKWWIDGNQLGTGLDMPLLNTTDSAFYVGRFTPGWFSYANVKIDEVRIYGQALTIGEIQKHYAEGLEGHQNLATK